MSVQAVSWVLEHSRSTGNNRCELIAIANRFDPKQPDNCWPGVGTIAAEANVSERTAQRCIAALKQSGELVVHYNAGGSGNLRANQRPNLYRIPGCQPDAPSSTGGDKTRAGGVTTVSPNTTTDSKKNIGCQSVTPSGHCTRCETRVAYDIITGTFGECPFCVEVPA